MGKIICAINMTLDGYFDHNISVPDKDVHNHYTKLLQNGDIILYGRKTFELMEYWREIPQQPNIEKEFKEFAHAIDGIRKIVFSTQPKSIEWPTAEFAEESLIDIVTSFKKEKDLTVYIGSRSLLLQLLEAKLLDELQLCIHPVANGHGRALFEGLKTRTMFKQTGVLTLDAGHTIIYLEPIYDIGG